ncbi:MAG: polyprenyl synthetase family protein [Syntrophales bacterium]|nr:polyprenyl synthetase family protein [Syntrophales bacterium]
MKKRVNIDISSYFSEKKGMIDEALDKILPPEDMDPTVLSRAMRYSMFAGGKRLRPILCIASAEVVGGRGEEVLPVACALECIHTYSLIHDDLPSMDNDDFRRGMPTNHRVFGEAVAILAGDALLTLAFNLLSSCFGATRPENMLRIIKEISSAAGHQGMVGGQTIDVLSTGKRIDEATLKDMHKRKTGALIRASLLAGALFYDVDELVIDSLSSYGEHLGLAFQIADDILNVTGDSSTMGKGTGSDARLGKATYPSILGLEEANKCLRVSVERALVSLENMDAQADILRAIAFFVMERCY